MKGDPVSQVRVKLTFPESEVRRPVLATLVRRFDVEPNIRRADVEDHRAPGRTLPGGQHPYVSTTANRAPLPVPRPSLTFLERGTAWYCLQAAAAGGA